MENLKQKVKNIKKLRNSVVKYSDYICKSIDNSISYSEYISESIMNYSNKNISYSEYLSDRN